jgi:general secretion pathway protein F
MHTFRYQALQANGAPVKGTIEAADRKSALQQLGKKGLFPSNLEVETAKNSSEPKKLGASAKPAAAAAPPAASSSILSGGRVSRKDITAFTGEMAVLLGAGIPIPQALDGLGEEEENPALKGLIQSLSDSVRKGAAVSAALEEHPRQFSKLYVSMVRVGEEAGALQKVMTDLATLLQHEDEVRGEVVAAVSYPLFVLGFGLFTVAILLTVVLPKLFGMLQEMLDVLPLPTLILLNTSAFLKSYWPFVLMALVGLAAGIRYAVKTPKGAWAWDNAKLQIPVMGRVFQAAALGRFARTLGTLLKSGVSLLPALKIVETTIGNLVLSNMISQVTEETRGGHSLATPLRNLAVFPKTVIQMISVGEESGKLDDMLLKVADIQEREMRAKTKTLISLLAPALILVVGALVGFMVIALLLPIFKMSRAIK